MRKQRRSEPDDELVDAGSDEKHSRRSAAGCFAADADGLVVCVCGAHGHLNQLQYGWMCGVSVLRVARAVAVGGQGLLGEVVRADAEEVDVLCE